MDARQNALFRLDYYRLLKSKYEWEQEQLQAPTVHVIHQIQQGNYASATHDEEIQRLFEQIREINRRLSAQSDAKTQSVLTKEWNDLQQSASNADVQLKKRSDALLMVSRRVSECARASVGSNGRSMPCEAVITSCFISAA